MSNILVVGSSNTDMVVRTASHPAPGQTVLGGQFFMNPGGKGANQAVAAARFGGQVTFITKTGNDVFGATAIEQFKKEGIDCRYIGVHPDAASGVALITVDAKGENAIVVAPGANGTLSIEDVSAAKEAIGLTDMVLLQLEIPLATVEHAVALATAAGKCVILNPAPAQALSDELLKQLSFITPNETEAETLTGIAVNNPESALEAAKVLVSRGVATAIITLGSEGALIWDGEKSTHIQAPKVNVVDTTAAGDVFNGVLAVALADGMYVTGATAFAIQAAAISVTRPGAQSAAPTKEEILSFIEQDRSEKRI